MTVVCYIKTILKIKKNMGTRDGPCHYFTPTCPCCVVAELLTFHLQINDIEPAS